MTGPPWLVRLPTLEAAEPSGEHPEAAIEGEEAAPDTAHWF